MRGLADLQARGHESPRRGPPHPLLSPTGGEDEGERHEAVATGDPLAPAKPILPETFETT